MTLPSYPNEIPTLTSVPSWAYLNIEAIISPSSNPFDANVLFKGDQRHMGFTTGSRSCGSTATEATTTATEAQNTFSSGVAIPTTSTSQRSSGVNAGAIAGGVVGGVAFLAIVAVICYWYSLRRKRRNDETEVNMVEPHFPPNPTTPYNTAMASGSVMRETPGHRSQQGSITSLNTYSPPITDRTYSSNYFSSPTSPATSAAYTTFDPYASRSIVDLWTVMDQIAAFVYLSMYTVRPSACCPISNIAGCNANFLSRNLRIAPTVNEKVSLNILGEMSSVFGSATRAAPFFALCRPHGPPWKAFVDFIRWSIFSEAAQVFDEMGHVWPNGTLSPRAPNIYVMWRQFGSRTVKGQQGPCELAAKKDEACSRGDDLRPFLSNDLHIPPQLHLSNDTSSANLRKRRSMSHSIDRDSRIVSLTSLRWDSWTAGCKKPLDIRLHPAVGNLLKFPVEALADISQIEPPSQHKVPPESRPPTPSRVVTTATVTTPPQTEVNGALDRCGCVELLVVSPQDLDFVTQSQQPRPNIITDTIATEKRPIRTRNWAFFFDQPGPNVYGHTFFI
ncbi:hypothetical protein EYR36_000689 [Pleurotus pulmonarius]|nr:hypothetical protein EYR36_004694 [Pleurotus pulmonarius]KAF4578881.1 hypothetical protein EYR36_000689 [Pleurotus pulmonarius]